MFIKNFNFKIFFFFLSCIAIRIGHYFNVRTESSRAVKQKNDKDQKLEVYFNRCANPSEAIKMSLAKELNQTYEQVDEWFKARQNIQKHGSSKTTPMNKFTESMWRFVFYFGIFMYGLIVLMKVNF